MSVNIFIRFPFHINRGAILRVSLGVEGWGNLMDRFEILFRIAQFAHSKGKSCRMKNAMRYLLFANSSTDLYSSVSILSFFEVFMFFLFFFPKVFLNQLVKWLRKTLKIALNYQKVIHLKICCKVMQLDHLG